MAVCYEVVFEDLMAREVRDGAELLATLTNDGWYGYRWAPRQHFAHVVLRAVENRRWFARAALTGISGFVAPDGRVLSRLEVGEHGLLVAELWPSQPPDAAVQVGRLVGVGLLGGNPGVVDSRVQGQRVGGYWESEARSRWFQAVLTRDGGVPSVGLFVVPAAETAAPHTARSWRSVVR